jgi:hypothetical protein
MKKVLYRGTGSETDRGLGTCWATSIRTAASYVGGAGDEAVVLEAELDLAGLEVVEVDGYDRDDNWAPGDDGDFERWGADVLVFEDEDPFGRPHWTWRLVSNKAVAALDVVDVWPVREAEMA